MAAINGDFRARGLTNSMNPPPPASQHFPASGKFPNPPEQALAKCDHTKTQLKSLHFYASAPRKKKDVAPKGKSKENEGKAPEKNACGKLFVK